jgi:hypothetical protein
MSYEQTCLCALDPEHWSEYAGVIPHPTGLYDEAFVVTRQA